MENSHIALYFQYLCWKIISTNFEMNKYSQNVFLLLIISGNTTAFYTQLNASYIRKEMKENHLFVVEHGRENEINLVFI